jgi:hypothetical protein
MGTPKTEKKVGRCGGQVEAQRVGTIPDTAESTPPRGIKLKTVSRLTMLFAAICLLAFMAGRPPGAASGLAATVDRESVVTVLTGSTAAPKSDVKLEGSRFCRAKPWRYSQTGRFIWGFA